MARFCLYLWDLRYLYPTSYPSGYFKSLITMSPQTLSSPKNLNFITVSPVVYTKVLALEYILIISFSLGTRPPNPFCHPWSSLWYSIQKCFCLYSMWVLFSIFSIHIPWHSMYRRSWKGAPSYYMVAMATYSHPFSSSHIHLYVFIHTGLVFASPYNNDKILYSSRTLTTYERILRPGSKFFNGTGKMISPPYIPRRTWWYSNPLCRTTFLCYTGHPSAIFWKLLIPFFPNRKKSSSTLLYFILISIEKYT